MFRCRDVDEHPLAVDHFDIAVLPGRAVFDDGQSAYLHTGAFGLGNADRMLGE